MTGRPAAATTSCPVPPDPPTARDQLILQIERDPKSQRVPLPEHEALWVGQLRRTGAAKVRHCGYPGLVESAELLISELVTNALRYGTGEAVVFRLVLVADAFVIEVDDGSPGRPQVREAGPEEESGRGMLLVSAVADEWGVSPDGTRTWCVLKVPQAEQAS